MKVELSDVWFDCPACAQQAEVIVRARKPYLHLFCGACGSEWPLSLFVQVTEGRATDGNRMVCVQARRAGA